MHWRITPYRTPEVDCCVMPADTDEHHRAALEYAQARLEEAWDRIMPGESETVTLELIDGEMPDPDVGQK
jgi:hypothetical protein